MSTFIKTPAIFKHYNPIRIVVCLCTLLWLTLLTSCKEKKQEHQVPEVPAALQDTKMNMKSSGRYSANLTDELYADMVEQNPVLQKLEEDLKIYAEKPQMVKETFDHYNNKSLNYYASASEKADRIKDSVLKQKITAFIKHSNERYLKKTNRINELLNQISENNTDLRDRHTVLKIMLTIPLIEKYQTDQAIAEKEFKDLLKEQETLLKQTDQLIPQF